MSCRTLSSRLKLMLVLVVAAISALVVAQTSDDNYVLGPEDVISITVLKHPDYSGKYFIPTVGLIELPVVGPVKASGMTIADLSAYVKTQLSTLKLKKPEVSVVLEIPRPKKMSVLGAVVKPGTVDMKSNWRVTDALGAAGGVPPEARLVDLKAYIIRAGQNDRTDIDLTEALAGKPEANLTINEGDVLYISAPDMITVYVDGSVKTPNMYRIQSATASPMQAIAMAGGLLPGAATSKMKIRHVGTTTEETYDITPLVNGTGTVELPALKPGDTVSVPPSDQQFAVMGYVAAQGVQVMPEGRELRLSEAIAMAKPTDRARLSRIGIIRTDPATGQEVRTQYDYGKYVSKGDKSQNPVIKSKDVIYVPETDKVDWGILSPIGVIARLFW